MRFTQGHWRTGALGAAALACAAPTAPAGGATAAHRPGRANVSPGSALASVASCHAGLTPKDRYAVFTSQMSAIHSSARMAVRFDLYGLSDALGTDARPGPAASAPAYKHLAGPGLGVWYSSQPGVSIFDYHQTVAALPYGSYRAAVRYRWYSPKGRVIRREHRVSPVCHEPDQRPNLVAGLLTHAPAGEPNADQYTVTVVNRGLGAAGPFGVSVSIDGVAQPIRTVPGLGAGARTTVLLTGPRCPAGSSVAVNVDSANQIDETTKADNLQTISC